MPEAGKPASQRSSTPEQDYSGTIRSLLVARLLIVTALMGSAIYVRIFHKVVADSFYYIIGATFLLTIFYGLLSARLRHSRLFLFIQLIIDQLLISTLVLATGGIQSTFIIFYYLPVLVAAMILGRLSSLLNSVLAIVCLSLVAALANTGWFELTILFPNNQLDGQTILYSLAIHVVALGSVALLSGNLAQMLQHTAANLRMQTRDLMRLRAINDTIVKNISIGILTTDMESRIRFVNPAAQRLLQRSSHQLLSKNIYEYLEFKKDAPQIITGEQRWIREMILLREDGTGLEVSVSRSFLMDENPEGNGKLYIIQDLHELKTLRKQLIIKDRLALAGEMSAALAHEIRNPLGAISGSAQMIEKTENLPEDTQSFIGIIVRESERLNTTLDEFLTFARQPSFSPNRTDLGKTVKETIALIRNSPQVTRKHRIVLEGTENQSLYAHADPAMVKQLVYNVVLNGIRAMPDGGHLSIELSKDDEMLGITIIDTGSGVPSDMMEQLFQPFATRSSGGVGLGLAVVFRIVREHGGEIVVRSAEGKGTAFRVLLPIEGRDKIAFKVSVKSGDPKELESHGNNTDR